MITAPAPVATAGTAAPATMSLEGLEAALTQLVDALTRLVEQLRAHASAGVGALGAGPGAGMEGALGGVATHGAHAGHAMPAADHSAHAGHGRRAFNISPHFTGELQADGRYHSKRLAFDPQTNAVIVKNTGDVTKMLLPRTQPEDRAKAAAFLQEVMAAAPRTQAEAEAMGYRQKDGTHWVKESNKRDGVTGDPQNPELLMIQDGMVTGAVFTTWGEVGSTNLPDFGMGGWHIHPHVDQSVFNPADYYGTNKTQMQHVMFRPDDLDMAFMDGQFMGDHQH